MDNFDYDTIVIGTGFGGTISALSIAREFYIQSLLDPSKPKRKVLMLERGTWWTTPVGTVADKELGTYTLLKKLPASGVLLRLFRNHVSTTKDLKACYLLTLQLLDSKSNRSIILKASFCIHTFGSIRMFSIEERSIPVPDII